MTPLRSKIRESGKSCYSKIARNKGKADEKGLYESEFARKKGKETWTLRGTIKSGKSGGLLKCKLLPVN